MYDSKIIKDTLDNSQLFNYNNKKINYTKIQNNINKKHNLKISRRTITRWINGVDIYKNRILKEGFNKYNISSNPLLKRKSYKLDILNYKLILTYVKINPLCSRKDIQKLILIDSNIYIIKNYNTNI